MGGTCRLSFSHRGKGYDGRPLARQINKKSFNYLYSCIVLDSCMIVANYAYMR
jgi:hypothetical protein